MARVLALLVVTTLGRPTVAAACATCLWSAYGDRTFNWAFLGLIAMPFVVAAAIGGTLLYRYRMLSMPRGFRSLVPGPAHSSEPSQSSPRGPHASDSSGAARLAHSDDPSHHSPRGPHASGSSGAARLAPPSEERS